MKPTDLHPAIRTERPFRRGSDEEKLFLAAVGMIPKHYRSFDMGAVMDEEEEYGTVCCFAGIVGLLAGIDLSNPLSSFLEPVARKLDLDQGVATNLVYPEDWPPQFYQQLDAVKPRTPEYAAIAHKRFMHFYRTGK